MNRQLAVLSLAVVILSPVWLACGGEEPRLLNDFESAEDVAPIAKTAEAASVEFSNDKGVTSGKGSMRVTFKKGAQWSAFILEGDILKGWGNAESLCVDVFTDEETSSELEFELFDARSTNHATRCTLHGAKIEKGQHTLKWSLLKPRRNEKETVDSESLTDGDKVDLNALTKVKFFTTPPADHDRVVYFDNLRLTPKGAAQLEAEKKAVEADKSEKIIYFADFENGKGLRGPGVPFKANWGPLDDNLKAEIAAPLGKGNDSQKVLSVSAAKKVGSICMELPMHHTVCEPENWDCVISMRLYNGGFASFQMTYSPIIPSDTTFHRANFNAPKGEWTQVEVPLDKFLFHGRRPRRGCPLEYLCFIGVGPEQEGSVFQLDDFKIRRVRRQGLPAPKPKAKLPIDVVYRQDFDDAQDFDIEGYYPFTKNCNAFRVAGGLDNDLKPVAAAKEGEAEPLFGCLKIECDEKNHGFLAGRNLDFSGEGNVIEFDCLLQGASDLSVVARTSKGKWRTYPKPPETGKWTHVAVSAEELALFGTSVKDAVQNKASKGEKFFALFISATSDNSGTSFLLVDNLTVRKGSVPAAAENK